MIRFRIWLIRCIARRMIVAINLRIIDGGIQVKATDPPGVIDNCTIIRAKDSSVYIEYGAKLYGYGTLTTWRGEGDPS